jgi:hypothetical protein
MEFVGTIFNQFSMIQFLKSSLFVKFLKIERAKQGKSSPAEGEVAEGEDISPLSE